MEGEILSGRGQTQDWERGMGPARRVTILGGGDQGWSGIRDGQGPEEELQEEKPLPGPESGVLSNTRK